MELDMFWYLSLSSPMVSDWLFCSSRALLMPIKGDAPGSWPGLIGFTGFDKKTERSSYYILIKRSLFKCTLRYN